MRELGQGLVWVRQEHQQLQINPSTPSAASKGTRGRQHVPRIAPYSSTWLCHPAASTASSHHALRRGTQPWTTRSTLLRPIKAPALAQRAEHDFSPASLLKAHTANVGSYNPSKNPINHTEQHSRHTERGPETTTGNDRFTSQSQGYLFQQDSQFYISFHLFHVSR